MRERFPFLFNISKIKIIAIFICGAKIWIYEKFSEMIINDNSDRYRCGSAFEKNNLNSDTLQENVVAKLRERA